ncbi:hypothetical protein, partial [Halomonas nitroreducens]
EAGSWKLEAGSWKLEAGSWKLEAGSWKLEAGSWKLEAGRQNVASRTRVKGFLPASGFCLNAPGEPGRGFLQASSFQARSAALQA